MRLWGSLLYNTALEGSQFQEGIAKAVMREGAMGLHMWLKGVIFARHYGPESVCAKNRFL